MFKNIFQSLSDKQIHIVVLAGIVLLFILALLPQSFIWIFIKIIFFLALISFVILQYQGITEDENPEDKQEQDFEELGNIRQDWLQIENDQDVEELFQKFLEDTISLVKKVLVSNTVILLFANFKKKEFTVRHRISDHQESVNPQNSIDIYKGLPSLVLRNRTPLIENHLPDGPEILPYYKPGENPSRSFIGIPVYYKDIIIGVLCADSSVEEAFSNDDLEIMKHFGQLISVQLFGSNKLYEYESENWLANILFDVSQQMNRVQSVEELWSYLLRKLPEVIPCDRISISRKQNEKQGQIIALQGGTGNLKPGRMFSLSEGIVGWVMRKNQTLLVDDFAAKENYVPRFGTNETPSKEYLSLLALPIAVDKKIIAVLCLESCRPRNFKEQHKRILQTICNQAANMYLITQTLDRLKSMNYRDPDTKLENLNAFKFVFPRELRKSTRMEYQMNLLFMKLYFQTKEDNQEIQVKTLNEFLSLVLPNLPESDYIFQLYPETFVVICSPSDEEGISKLAKKIMTKIMEKKIWADGQVFDFYVNLGIVPASYLNENIDSMVQLGDASIKLSRLKGPNKVIIYQEPEEDTDENLQDAFIN
jgi:GAF domain-containing protein